MRNLKITFFLALVTTIGFAQEGAVPLKEYSEYKKRKLLVIIEEPVAKVTAKLSPEQLEIYNKEMEDYNTLVKWALDTYYKLPQTVEYVKRSEAVQILKSDKGTYAYLEYSKFSTNYQAKIGFELVQKNRTAKDQTRLGGIISLSSILSAIDIRVSEDYNKVEDNQNIDPLYREFMPTPFPGKFEMAYAIQQIAAVFEWREQGVTYDKEKKQIAAEGKAKTQTLLIAEGDISPKEEDRDKFLAAYKYPASVVSYEKIAEAVINRENVSCIVTVPMMDKSTEAVQFRFFMFDCATGRTLASSVPQDNEKSGVSTATISAFKSMKKAVTESKVPQLTRANMEDFSSSIR